MLKFFSVLHFFCPNLVVKDSEISQENTSENTAVGGLKLYYNETPTQFFSCEYFEIFKNSFYRALLVAASGARFTSLCCTAFSTFSSYAK